MSDLRRIGDKLVDRDRVVKIVDEVLSLRQSGLSQQEVAARLGTDRTLVSRLETLGEIRKGGRIAVIGIPVANKDELLAVTAEMGVDFAFILDEKERWAFLEGKTGLELFSEAAGFLEKVYGHDVVVLLGYNRPARVLEALLERQSIIFHLPQVEGRDAYFDPAALAALLGQVKGGRT